MENIKRFVPRLKRCCMIFIFFFLASIALSDNHPLLDIGDSEDVPGSGEDKYSFSWSVSYEFPSEEDVKDESVEFGHEESRDGDFTEGSYFVQLPGNRLQTVEYFVRGDSGFVAKVRVISNESAELEGGEEE